MFGYCNSNRCEWDLWSPSRSSRADNIAFSAYAKHTTEIEEIINILVENARIGNMDVNIETDEFLSEQDWEFIREEVQNRL